MAEDSYIAVPASTWLSENAKLIEEQQVMAAGISLVGFLGTAREMWRAANTTGRFSFQAVSILL